MHGRFSKIGRRSADMKHIPKVVDITDKVKELIGEQVKYAAVGTTKKRSKLDYVSVTIRNDHA